MNAQTVFFHQINSQWISHKQDKKKVTDLFIVNYVALLQMYVPEKKERNA